MARREQTPYYRSSCTGCAGLGCLRLLALIVLVIVVGLSFAYFGLQIPWAGIPKPQRALYEESYPMAAALFRTRSEEQLQRLRTDPFVKFEISELELNALVYQGIQQAAKNLKGLPLHDLYVKLDYDETNNPVIQITFHFDVSQLINMILNIQTRNYPLLYRTLDQGEVLKKPAVLPIILNASIVWEPRRNLPEIVYKTGEIIGWKPKQRRLALTDFDARVGVFPVPKSLFRGMMSQINDFLDEQIDGMEKTIEGLQVVSIKFDNGKITLQARMDHPVENIRRFDPLLDKVFQTNTLKCGQYSPAEYERMKKMLDEVQKIPPERFAPEDRAFIRSFRDSISGRCANAPGTPETPKEKTPQQNPPPSGPGENKPQAPAPGPGSQPR